MQLKPERESNRMPKRDATRLSDTRGELSSAQLHAVSGGTEATATTVTLKKLPGKKKPPTLILK
jgi:hypothetical protein